MNIEPVVLKDERTGRLMIRDPHHNGCSWWSFNGTDLYHRSEGQSRWTRINRISFTRKRLAAINMLISAFEYSEIAERMKGESHD
jgi:hypothetical protein